MPTGGPTKATKDNIPGGDVTYDCISVSAVPAVDHTSELVDDDYFDVELLLHLCIRLDGLGIAGCVNGKSLIALL